MLSSNNGHLSNTSKNISLAVQIAFALIAVFLIGFFIYGQFINKNPQVYSFYCDNYTGEWTYTSEAGDMGTFVAPTVLDIYSGVPVTLTTTLPDDLKNDSIMFVRTGVSFVVYVVGQERFSLDGDNTGLPGLTVKSIWLPVYLNEEDSGKTLSLVRYSNASFNGNVNEIYIANMMGFINKLFRDNLFIILLSVFLVIFCVAMILIFLISYFIRKEMPVPIFLYLGILITSAWLITDSYAYPFIFQNYFIDGLIENLITLMIPVPFIRYINLTQNRRYNSLHNILNIVLIASFVLFAFLDFSGISSYNDTLLMMDLIIGLVILAVIISTIYDIFYRKNKYYSMITIGFLVFIVFSIAEIIHINLEFHSNDGIFIAIGLFFLIIFTAIEELRKIVLMQRNSYEATQSNNAKSSFLANMSHEIRTPINAIMGLNTLVLREPVSDAVKEYSNNIHAASQTLLEIVNDILDFSKIEQGRMELVENDYNLPDLLSNVISMIRVKADEKNLSFRPEIAMNLPQTLHGDSKHIREVMINLLNNAVKYTPSGSIIFHVNITETNGKPMLCFKIKDTGIGIKDEDRPKIFKTFERLDISKNRSIEGSGLGLAITSGLVELMSGSIDFDSVYGHGTTFTVMLPQEIVDATPIGNFDSYISENETKKNDDSYSFLAPTCSILIVDDNLMNLKVISGLLARTQLNITTCQSGPEMLTLITRKHFDVILLDHMMPDMDGIEALQESKNIYRNLNTSTPYIALTANAINGAREMYLSHGFTDYLSKPIDISEMEHMLIGYLPKDKVQIVETSQTDKGRAEATAAKEDIPSDSIPDINITTGLTYCGGMKDFYHDTVALFMSISDEKINNLQQAIENEDFHIYQVTIHSLKSTSLTIGAEGLSSMSKDLEMACKESDFEYVKKHHDNVMMLYKNVLKQCEVLIQQLKD